MHMKNIIAFFLPRLILLTLSITSASVIAAEEFTYGQYKYEVNADTPSWVEPVKPAKPGKKIEGRGEEFLLVDTQILADHQQFEKYYASSTLLHTSQAVASGSEIQIFFNPSYQELVIHDISVVRKNKKLDRLRPESVRLLQREEDLRNGIYNGVITAVIIVPDTRVGDRIETAYTIKGRNPVYGEKVFGAAPLGWGVDVALANVRVLIPNDVDVKVKSHRSSIKEKERKKGKYREITWKGKDIAAITNEGDYPAWYVPYPWVEFSEFASWDEVEDWADTLYSTIDQNSSELNEIIQQLKKESTSRDDYVGKALEFAQEEIRYLGLEFGQNSHLPHSPTEVLENRFGDCKDKSNLLVQMLRANNIQAFPALVSHSYRKGFADFLPSPMAFDHVIVNAIIDGKSVWLDPTKTLQGNDINKLGFTPYGKGLVIGRLVGDPVTNIGALPSQQDTVLVTEHFTVNDISAATMLKVTSRHQGGSAELQRYLFAVSTQEEMQDRYLNYYTNIYPKIEVDAKLTIEDDIVNNHFVVNEYYRIPEFSALEENVHTSMFYADAVGQYLRIPRDIRRDAPIYIGDPRRLRHKIVIDFEEDAYMGVDGAPKITRLPELEFTTRSTYFNKRFEYDAELFIKQDSVTSKGLENYLSLGKEIKNDIDFSLSYYYPYQQPNSSARKELLQRLEVIGRE
ncbi:hypothetical protein NBRC116493_22400 [Aurantivibrio infirmus]